MTISTAGTATGTPVVVLSGRWDAVNAPQLRETLGDLISRGSYFLVVDMRAVDFMDSATLAALVKARTDSLAMGGDVELIAPSAPEAQRILRLTHFDKIFTMRDGDGQA